MYLPFQSNFPSCLEIFALFSAFIFTRFAKTLSFVLEFWVSSLSFEFFHPWVFLARSKKKPGLKGNRGFLRTDVIKRKIPQWSIGHAWDYAVAGGPFRCPNGQSGWNPGHLHLRGSHLGSGILRFGLRTGCLQPHCHFRCDSRSRPGTHVREKNRGFLKYR